MSRYQSVPILLRASLTFVSYVLRVLLAAGIRRWRKPRLATPPSLSRICHVKPLPQDLEQRPSLWQSELQSSHTRCSRSCGSGIEHMTVIRANDLDSLFVQVRTVTHMVKMARQKSQDTPGEREAPEGWCDIHNVQMTRGKDGKGFFHKAGQKSDGKALWCRGK